MRRGFRGNAVTLRHVKTVVKPSGRVFRYLRIPGQVPVRLPDGPMDSPEFLAAYAAAMAAAKPARAGTKPATGSIAAAVMAYQQSDRFLALRASTRDMQRRILSKIVAKAGTARLSDLRARHIEADIKGLAPHVANHRRKVWRALCAWTTEAGLIAANPATDVTKRRAPASDGHRPWTADDVTRYREKWHHGTRQRLAFELMFWTAARASDAAILGPGMIDKAGWLVFRQTKTGGEVAVPFSRGLPEFAAAMQADLDHLHAAIAAMADRHMTWIVTRSGAPQSRKSFSSWFAASARAAGVEKSAHGLRKTRAQMLAEAGATAHQIAAWTGHESLSEVQRYARAADKRRILSGQPEQETNGNWKPAPILLETRK